MRIRLFADYCQIHILDESSEGELAERWTNEALTDRLVAVRDILGIRTEVDVDVQVEISSTSGRPSLDMDPYDHVVEASVEIPSGRMVVMGCSDYLPDATRVEVEPGWVRIRVQKSNLANAVAADLESDESPETIERIKVDVWPEDPSGVRVLKQWNP
ncbi:hypothetical protein ACIPPM_15765 [Streptomyces sp. NPDC090119]|uniref:hypothetical protein n=1 Tax=Streptomyces sp. NPDC090119 TaxID=3365951 RepID=UPI00381F4B47